LIRRDIPSIALRMKFILIKCVVAMNWVSKFSPIEIGFKSDWG